MDVWVPSETHWTAKGSMTCLLSHTLLNTPQHSTDRSGEEQSPCLYLCVCTSFSLRRSQSISLSFPLSFSLSLSISPSLLLFPLSRTILPRYSPCTAPHIIHLFYSPILPPFLSPYIPPCRDALDSHPGFGDKKTYQQVPGIP